MRFKNVADEHEAKNAELGVSTFSTVREGEFIEIQETELGTKFWLL